MCCRSRLVISSRSFWTRRGKITFPRLPTMKLLRSQHLYLQITHPKSCFHIILLNYLFRAFLPSVLQEVKAARERHMDSTRPKSRNEDATFHPSEVSHQTHDYIDLNLGILWHQLSQEQHFQFKISILAQFTDWVIGCWIPSVLLTSIKDTSVCNTR